MVALDPSGIGYFTLGLNGLTVTSEQVEWIMLLLRATYAETTDSLDLER